MEKAFAQRVYLFLHLWLEMLRSVRFCNSDRASITYEKTAEEIRKRVEANDAGAIYMLARHYYHGHGCFEPDHAKAIDLFNRSANLGFSKAHSRLGYLYHEVGDLKKAKFHSVRPK